MRDIAKIEPNDTPLSIVDHVDRAKEFIAGSVPESTKRAYASDWALFSDWCEDKRIKNIPADPRTIAAFLADQSSTHKPSTLRRRLAAIAKMHSIAGHPNPCSTEAVKATIKGIERVVGTAPESKAPATHERIEQMMNACAANTLEGLRARAILLVGYAGAFRRSEIVALDVPDLLWSKEGVRITVRRSKTDQAGKGMVKAIPYVDSPTCAATALKVWLTAAGITQGPVFRGFTRNGLPRTNRMGAHAVAVIVKETARRCGFSGLDFSGHSLRAGHVTEARARGVSDASTMATTGHKRVETLNLYDRRENAFQKTSAGSVLTKER